MAKNTTENRLQRDMQGVAVRQVEGEDNVFELSFSSEQPVKRWFGDEYLDHDRAAVDLTRLRELGVVLFNHNRDKVIGKIRKVWIENNRGKAEVEFDKDDFSKEIREKVISGTLKGVSVGYCVTRYEDIQNGQKSKDGRFKGPAKVATRWFPYEISIVSVPADETVGVGRDLEGEPHINLRNFEAQLQVNINKSL